MEENLNQGSREQEDIFNQESKNEKINFNESKKQENNFDQEVKKEGSNFNQESKKEEKNSRKKGFKAWWAAHKPSKRRLIQLYVALLVNANIKGFLTGKIYTGQSKNFCIPGFNCYSCPGAVGACPLGSLQNALASSGTRAPYYVFGILILFGLLLGRTICGFLCPIGLGQELLYKIKTPKLKKSRFTRLFSYLKYVLLAVFVVAIPIMFSKSQGIVPGFCKYICPVGTFGGAMPLLLHPGNADLFGMLGPIFTWKFCVMVAVIVASVFIFRFFCRFMCPLGAIYGFFNKISLLGVKLDQNKCTDCGLCVEHCKMDIKHVGDHECVNCGDCIKICPAKAIRWKGSKLFLHENALPAEEALEAKPLFDARTHLSISEIKEETAVSDNSNIPEPEVPQGNPQKGRKNKHNRNFWLQVGAWTLALLVLAGSLIYYNVLEDKLQEGKGPDPNIDIVNPNDKESGNEVGKICYNFRVDTYANKATNNESGYFRLDEHRGEVILINFWYTTCDPCVEEMPELNLIAEEYDLTVIAIHSAGITTNPATKEGVQAWLETWKDTVDNTRTWKDFSVIFGQDTGKSNTDSLVYKLLGGKGPYPMSLLVDTEGVIQFKLQGKFTEGSFTEFYEKLDELGVKKK